MGRVGSLADLPPLSVAGRTPAGNGVAVGSELRLSDPLLPSDFQMIALHGTATVRALVPDLQRLALSNGQPGGMHGLELLLGSQFIRRKQPCLICFYHPGNTAPILVGAVLMLEYRVLGLRVGLFSTPDAFGVRDVVGPWHLHGTFCALAAHFLLRRNGARLVLATWRQAVPAAEPVRLEAETATAGPYLYALATRSVQDTLLLATTAEQTLQSLGKRTRVHLRAARRRFDRECPQATLQDAAKDLSGATDDTLRRLNEESLDVIDQEEFNHQVRSLCSSPGGFVLGLLLHGRWIGLIGGWRQGTSTWIEWQCNGRGLEKLSIGSVLRTYLLEQEVARGATHLGFHGGTSHSMLHRFQHTAVADLLVRKPGPATAAATALAVVLCTWWPQLKRRGNFLLNALCRPGLQWSSQLPVECKPLPAVPGEAQPWS